METKRIQVILEMITRGTEKIDAYRKQLNTISKTTRGASREIRENNKCIAEQANLIRSKIGPRKQARQLINSYENQNKLLRKSVQPLKDKMQITRSLMSEESRMLSVNKNSLSTLQRTAKQQVSMVNPAQKLADKNKFLNLWSGKLGVSTARVQEAMGNAGVTIDNTGRAIDIAGGKIKNIDKRMRGGEIATRRFEMSLLSVMFAGMALQKGMSSLLRSSAESTGVFEVMGEILTTVFSPIMEAVLPMLEWFSDIMDRMPGGIKLVVGAIVLFLLAAGMMLAIAGQLGLAYGGLGIQLGKLTLALGTTTTAFSTMGTAAAASGTAVAVAGTTASVAFAPFLIIAFAVLAVVALIVLAWYRWEEIVSGMKNTLNKFNSTVRLVTTSSALFFGWLGDKIIGFGKSTKKVFTSVSDFASGTWTKIGSFLSETWDNIKKWFKEKWGSMIEWFKKKWTGLKKWFNGILLSIRNFFKSIWQGIGDFFGTILTSIKTFFKEKWESLSTWFSGKLTFIKTFFKEKWEFIKTWFSKHLNKVYNFFKDIWNNIGNFLSEKLTSIKTTFSNIWNGIKNTTSSIWGGITGVIKSSINIIIGLINRLTGAWNSLSFTVPRIRIPFLGTFGGGTYGVPRIPSIPFLADGGIVSKPTLAMIGESGPEAVIPLNKKYNNVNRNSGRDSSNITLSPSYNINVADKYEFEQMIKNNNNKLVEDLRRLINI